MERNDEVNDQVVTGTSNTVDSNSDGVQAEQQASEGVRPEASAEVVSFHARYKDAMLAWVKQHKNTNFPVVEDPVTKKLRWVNRAERRRYQKKHGPKVKVYVHNYK